MMRELDHPWRIVARIEEGAVLVQPPSLVGFGSCGGTRFSLTNWFTRISKLTP
jgi:hypothetical protein